MNKFKNLTIAIIFGLSIATSALAQGTGAIKGTVTDENGAKINGAQVVLSSSTGVHLNTSTDESGTFEYKNLRSGSYFIEVKANGFSVFTSDEILFSRGENKDLAVQLRVAAINASVVVTATGTAQRADEVSKVVSTLDSQEIEAKHELTLTGSVARNSRRARATTRIARCANDRCDFEDNETSTRRCCSMVFAFETRATSMDPRFR